MVSSRMDFANWNESIYPKLMKRQTLNQLLLLKFETGIDLKSHDVLVGSKVYANTQ